MPFQRKKPAQPLTVDEAIGKLENFCAYRERCPKEVRSRLTELGLRGPEFGTDPGGVAGRRFLQ